MFNRDGIDIGKKSVKLILLAASIGLMCAGCMLESPAAPAAQASADPTVTVGTEPQGASLRGSGNPNVPPGCSMAWSAADGDSVAYCPDIAPPSAPR